MSAQIEESKKIQLTINKLTNGQYQELVDLSSIQLSTTLSDQIFMTIDDTGDSGDSGGGKTDIIYMSPEEYDISAKSGMLDEEKYYATSSDNKGSSSEEWSFTLEDGTIVHKTILVLSSWS